MLSQIKRWGESLALRIPASVASEASLYTNQLVEVRFEDGRIVGEPIATRKYDLDALIEAMRPETFPEEEDFRPPVGQEIW